MKMITVEAFAEAELPTRFAASPLRVQAFRASDGSEYLALVKGPLPAHPLVRLHSECLTGDALGSLRCDCGAQLSEAIRLVGESDGGLVIYLRNQEGRGIGLANKIRAYALQDQGLDTVDANTTLGFAADARNYEAGAAILRTFSITQLTLLSNNSRKAEALRALGFEVEERPLVIPATPHSLKYLRTKQTRLGHKIFDEQDEG
jgi:3,4-dihydroxy 2-butanone 4-phosphate synthase / GTP cyclohydrolase II